MRARNERIGLEYLCDIEEGLERRVLLWRGSLTSSRLSRRSLRGRHACGLLRKLQLWS